MSRRIEQATGPQRRIAQNAGADGDVRLFRDQVDGLVAEFEVDAHARVLVEKPNDERREHMRSERQIGADFQKSADSLGLACDLCLCLGNFLHDGTRRLVEIAALRRQPETAGRAHDELYAETERLLREKEPAIHHLAKALIERDELIGDELEEVFAEVERAHPELLQQFERKIIPFRDFAPPERQGTGEGFFPQPVAQEAATEPAASVGGGAGSGQLGEAAAAIAEAQVNGWLPPAEGSGRDRNRRGRGPAGTGGPGMPTDVIPPWATSPRH